jgi:hypothetical protein
MRRFLSRRREENRVTRPSHSSRFKAKNRQAKTIYLRYLSVFISIDYSIFLSQDINYPKRCEINRLWQDCTIYGAV